MIYENFMAFDTETTGFRKSSEIVEISLVFFEKEKEPTIWDTTIRPVLADPHDPQVIEALRINKLTFEQLKDSPTFVEILPELIDQIRLRELWVAHNSSFDLRMLRQEFERASTSLPPHKALCTMSLDRILNPYKKGSKLHEVCTRWGVTLSDAHEASADAKACGEVFLRMREKGLPDIEKLLKKQETQQSEQETYFKNKRAVGR